jgi:hypothetical protein
MLMYKKKSIGTRAREYLARQQLPIKFRNKTKQALSYS